MVDFNNSFQEKPDRINLHYRSRRGSSSGDDVELPLRLLVMGNFKGHRQDTPVAERKALSVNANNFDAVMRESGISVTLNDTESQTLDFESLKDFHPDNIIQQHSTLRLYALLRQRLTQLKNPMSCGKTHDQIIAELELAFGKLIEKYNRQKQHSSTEQDKV